MIVEHEHKTELEKLKSENPLVHEIVRMIKSIDAMDEMTMDTDWERDLLKYKSIKAILQKYDK